MGALQTEAKHVSITVNKVLVPLLHVFIISSCFFFLLLLLLLLLTNKTMVTSAGFRVPLQHIDVFRATVPRSLARCEATCHGPGQQPT
jgi:hypothetical protein